MTIGPVSILVMSAIIAFPALAETGAFEVKKGVVSFTANTNISAVSVHGKSDTLVGHVDIHEAAKTITLENVDAQVDPSAITTGMALRDRHMREKIFTTQDGAVPALKFHSDKVECPAPAANQQSACSLSGTFYLRGVGRPFHMALKVRSEGKSSAQYRVTGEGSLQLSEYGVEPPSQLGIRVADHVIVTVDFVARQQEGVTASR